VEVNQKHKFGLFDRPGLIIPDLPQRVEETICRLLEKDPDKRFPDAFVLLRHLEQIVRLEDFAENAGATLDDDSDSLGPGPTVVATTYPGDAGLSRRPGPATVMKGLLREELSRDARGGPVASLFNNVFVLVLMLALVVAGGIWWFWPRRLSPQEQFDRGVALMDSHPEPGPEWLRARREFFEPLLAADAATWQDDVAPYLRKIELYELSRAARGKRAPRSSAPASEAERFLQLALHCRQTGDLARAERTLSALRALLSGDEKQSKMYDYAGALLDELHRERAKSEDRAGLLESSLARATALVDDGKIDQAREIWGGILELYADDPEADDAVRAARAAIEKHTDNGPAAPQR
jgi:serine/threonine-protein kinase